MSYGIPNFKEFTEKLAMNPTLLISPVAVPST